MKHQWVNKSGSERAIMIFGGWGSHASMFDGLRRPGYDIVVFWDYRDETFDPSVMAGYDEIFLIGWSMGVMEAQRILGETELPVVAALAVNGTWSPVDDLKGIPVDIFNGTLRGLDERSLWKFYRRVCGSAATLERLKQSLSYRSVGELADELAEIGTRSMAVGERPAMWSRAVVGGRDAIFPPNNQLSAWSEVATEVWDDMPHLPDWQKILDRYVVDKELVTSRFALRQFTYNEAGCVQTVVADELFKLWSPGKMTEADILEIGAGTGVFTSRYADKIRIGSLTLWDIADIKPTLPTNVAADVMKCDAELSIKSLADESLDYIVSSSTVQWFNSFPDFVKRCHRVLRHGGELVFSTYGPRTYTELRSLGLPLPSYLSEDMLLRVFDKNLWQVKAHRSKEIVERFDKPSDVFAHIKNTGVNAVHRHGRPVGELRRLLAEYPADCGGKVSLTYQPIFFVVEKL